MRRAQQLTFPSGFTVLVDEDHTRPVVAVASAVAVGASDDPEGKEGLAHLLEHLTFRSRHDGKLAFATQLLRAGVASWNAETRVDSTGFLMEGPRETLASMIRLEGARLARPFTGVDEATFAVERSVVKNELYGRDETGRMREVTYGLHSTLFPEAHPYSRYGLDSPETVEKILPADVQAFAARHYVPANMSLAIAGDVDLASLRALLAANLPVELLAGEGLKPTPLRLRALPFPPKGPQLKVVYGPVRKPTLEVAWILPAAVGQASVVIPNAATYFRALIGPADLLEGRHASVLVHSHALTGKESPENEARAYLAGLDGRWPQWQSTEQIRRADDVLDKLRPAIVAIDAQRFETFGSRAQARALGWALFHDASLIQDSKRIDELSFSQLVRVQLNFLRAEEARAVLVLPADARALTADMGKEGGGGGVLAPDSGASLRFAPGAEANLLQTPSLVGAKRALLNNGLEVIVVPRPKTDLVSMALAVSGGGYLGKGKDAASMFAPFVGVPSHHGAPGSLGDQFRYSQGPDFTLLGYSGMAGNVADLIAMLGDRLADSFMDQERFAKFSPLLHDALKADEKFAEGRFQRALSESIYGDPYRAHQASAGDESSLSAVDVQRFMNKTFRPDRMSLVVVGDVDPIAVFDAATTHLGEWRHVEHLKRKAVVAAATPLPDAHGQMPSAFISTQQIPQTLIGVGCALPTTTPRQRWVAYLLEFILWGELFHYGRETVGGIYDVIHVHEPRIEGNTRFELLAFVDDANLGKVAARTRADWSHLATREFTEDELNRAKWELARRSNGSFDTGLELANAVGFTRLMGWPMEAISPSAAELSTIGVSDLREVAAACGRTAGFAAAGGAPAIAPLQRAR